MTHELKTPISTISLACEALVDEDLSSKPQNRKRFINTIAEENKRIGTLVENVLQSAWLIQSDIMDQRTSYFVNRIMKNGIVPTTS